VPSCEKPAIGPNRLWSESTSQDYEVLCDCNCTGTWTSCTYTGTCTCNSCRGLLVLVLVLDDIVLATRLRAMLILGPI